MARLRDAATGDAGTPPAAPGRQPGSIEISNGVTRCIGFEEYPIAIEMAGVGDYVWPISEREFNEAWLRHGS